MSKLLILVVHLLIHLSPSCRAWIDRQPRDSVDRVYNVSLFSWARPRFRKSAKCKDDSVFCFRGPGPQKHSFFEQRSA